MTAEIKCHQCGKPFENWLELARHIISEKKTHKNKKDRAWALSFISKRPNQVEISHVASDPDKVKTEYGNEQRENARRKLSGENQYTHCVCPKCKKGHRILLEVDFTKSREAWRIGDKVVKLCMSCER